MFTRQLASPVSSPPFYYNLSSGIYVEVDGQRRVSRCSSARLYELLTYQDPGPAYTETGLLKAHQPRKHKDETQAFYTAQLTHYGLKPLKSKSAAKKALLTALEESKLNLTVLDSIQKVEQELKTEYAIKNAAAEEEDRTRRLAAKIAEVESAKKRKLEEAALMQEVLEEPATKKSKSHGKVDINALSGSYKIAAPAVSEEWDCDGPLTLDLALSSTTSHLWGHFNFGIFEGILRSSSPVEPGSPEIHFLWRGRETGEGESYYGLDYEATLTFSGNGTCTGEMYWDCTDEFNLFGKLDKDSPKTVELSDAVDSWKKRYSGSNDVNYRKGGVGRWGGWTWDYGCEVRESNSDTGNEGRDFRDEDEDSGEDDSSDEDEDSGEDDSNDEDEDSSEEVY